MDDYIEKVEDLYEMWSNTFTISDDPIGEIEIWPNGLINDLYEIKLNLILLSQPYDDPDRFDPVIMAKRIIQINVAIDKARIIDKEIQGSVYDFNQWKQMNIKNLIKDYGDDISDVFIKDDFRIYISGEKFKLLDKFLKIINDLKIV